ncbi:Threonine--tRNA ligase, cytoplasmic [Neolecta irregularis DAH-3]|uniref:Threonine--tRNA ligase, cytoplasmic n=1 Tax=Neolecta irregularis (strain DAH-3) TaxID=1198029 RepID=A0A1U7LGY0_NEOID|nr:Threonine--tRNA ligase, cytoplasmic [Neolecta irregularis DAH-3]|eukprot:OLL21853.1 Threonine--tRNA ligase, cytoplasmic [Neolecta irregularis DAH-3]
MDKIIDYVKDVTIGENQKKPSKNQEKEGIHTSPPIELFPPPPYFAERVALFDKLKKEYDEEIKSKFRWCSYLIFSDKPRVEIMITLPDGASKVGTTWETSPMAIAKDISKTLSESIVIAEVNGELWDLERPLERSCSLKFYKFDDPEGRRVFWHSSAHVLGEAAERHYGCNLCIGPPIEEGFFYEMGLEDRMISHADFPALETIVQSVVKEKQPFERLVLSKENLLKMFAYNKYKQYIIKDKIPDGTHTTVYRCGPLIDLCKGPHVPHTGRIKSFAVLKNSASYFLGDSKNDSLQRIYGISFPDKKQMTEYKTFLAEAAKRDHRKIGKVCIEYGKNHLMMQEQELFFFNELSPGSCFFLPNGTRIYNALMDFMREEYRKRGFQEVITPNMYNAKLWEQSGHWQKYAENMFAFTVEKEIFALKPMNCPGHCLMFNSRDRSYRELPLRYADFGVLHRNEASGALTGLTRVRRFQQDDAHIFCTVDQVQSEILACFDFLKQVYGIFGFTFKLELSTRPENFLGKIETWNEAERALESALQSWGGTWELNPRDGAFYGPKIDITVSDALKRHHQCATLQLDFQLPERFNLEYSAGETTEGAEKARPVMIHRAILGSVERMVAILTEHYAGKWPFWLSPRQVMVVPVTGVIFDYAQQVHDRLHAAGIYVDVDLSGSTLNKKIRNAQVAQYNFIMVVGQEEQDSRSVNMRNRDDETQQKKGQVRQLDEVIEKLVALQTSRLLANAIY